MSGSDQYRPSNRIEVVQVHQEFVNVPVRKYVGMEHDEKRAAASARTLRNQDIAEQDWREQVQDALLKPAYTGPVGTKRKPERMPSREEVGSVVIEHVVSEDTNMRKAEKALAARKAKQQQAREALAQIHQDQVREANMHDLGFGARTGVYL